MTAADWIQVAGFAVTIVTVVFTYLGTRGKVKQVHNLVNSQHDDLVNRASQLTNTLTNAGLDVPIIPEKNPHPGV